MLHAVKKKGYNPDLIFVLQAGEKVTAQTYRLYVTLTGHGKRPQLRPKDLFVCYRLWKRLQPKLVLCMLQAMEKATSTTHPLRSQWIRTTSRKDLLALISSLEYSAGGVATSVSYDNVYIVPPVYF